MRRLVAAAIVMALAVAPALSQSTAPSPTPAPAPIEAPPAYEPSLLRLAELIGSLDYLGGLCHVGQRGAFRDKMIALLDSESTTQRRKELLSGAFNRGYKDYELGYAACTPQAQTIIDRFLIETNRLARDVSDKFGG